MVTVRGNRNLTMADYDHGEIERALQELEASVAAPRAPPASMQVTQNAFEQRRLLALRTEVRMNFLKTLKHRSDPALNRTDKRIVEMFNELLVGVERLSNYEFQLKGNALLLANAESRRPRVSVYVDEMLDKLDVHDGYQRQRAAALILAPTPHERANPAARQRELFLFINEAKFSAWKAALVTEHGANYKIVFKEGRNPYIDYQKKLDL